MIDPTSAHVVLSAALAITLGVLVRVLCVRRVPTIRSAIQAEKKRVVRICKQAANQSSLLTPDVLERLEVAAARDETGQFRQPGHSRLRATARDCIRAQLIKALVEPSGLSSDGGTSVLADVLDQLQPGSTAAAGSLRIGLASAERDHGVITRRYWIQIESGLLVGIVEPSAHLQGFLDAERPPELDLGTAAGIAGRAGPLKQHFLGKVLAAGGRVLRVPRNPSLAAQDLDHKTWGRCRGASRLPMPQELPQVGTGRHPRSNPPAEPCVPPHGQHSRPATTAS